MCQRPLDSHWARRSQVRVLAAWAGASTAATVVSAARAAAAVEMNMRKRMRVLHTPSGLAVGFGLRCARPSVMASPRGPLSRPVDTGGFPAPALGAQGAPGRAGLGVTGRLFWFAAQATVGSDPAVANLSPPRWGTRPCEGRDPRRNGVG